MPGVDAGHCVDSGIVLCIIKEREEIMRKVKIAGVLTVGIIILSIVFSGCCPYSKKVRPVAQPKVTTEQETRVVAAPDKPEETPAKPPSKPPVTGPTEEEIKIALSPEGGLPPVKPEEGVKFGEPGQEIKEIFKTSEYGKVKAIADYLKKNPDVSILIEGHCDERGTDEYNLVLGEKRALSARNFLVGLGISPKRIYTISYGESMPADPRSNEEAWAKNRRCEFKIKQ